MLVVECGKTMPRLCALGRVSVLVKVLFVFIALEGFILMLADRLGYYYHLPRNPFSRVWYNAKTNLHEFGDKTLTGFSDTAYLLGLISKLDQFHVSDRDHGDRLQALKDAVEESSKANFSGSEVVNKATSVYSRDNVTVILLFDHPSENSPPLNLVTTLTEIRKNFIGMQLFLATNNDQLSRLSQDYLKVKLFRFAKSDHVSDILNIMIGSVNTYLTLIWPITLVEFKIKVDFNPIFTLFSNSAFVQVITFPMLKDKVRMSNCYMLNVKMYQLVLSQGHKRSFLGHPLCDYSVGPVISRTELISDNKNNFAKLHSKLMFIDFFMSLMMKGVMVVQCLTCGRFSHAGNIELLPSRNQLIPFIQKWDLNTLVVAGQHVKFSCEEADVMCMWKTNEYGMAMPLCCSAKENRIALDFFGFCETFHLNCQLNEGSILAALKLGRSMPWDIDADIQFEYQSQGIVYSNIFDYFKGKGYVISRIGGIIAFGVDHVDKRFDGVFLDFYPMEYQTKPISRGNVRSGYFRPTKVSFASRLVPVPFNPGIQVRHRYGHECYQHALHWRSMGPLKKDFFGGVFKPCQVPNHHACLDLYLPDGNLQFKAIEP